jgi:hypothetical protein
LVRARFSGLMINASNNLKNQRDIRRKKAIHSELRPHAGVGPQRDSWYDRVAENTDQFL